MNSVICFANTGKEMPATLDFVHEVETRWLIPIVWLEYLIRPGAAGGIKEPKHHYRITDHKGASRNGEPFEALIEYKAYLPNQRHRICTQELKVKVIRNYVVRELGIEGERITNVMGIRDDERRRVKKALMEECKAEYPMVYAQHSKLDVEKFWAMQEFSLQIHKAFGNCDLCFLKGRKQKEQVIRLAPQLADWWVSMEKVGMTFRSEYTYQDIVDAVESQPEIDFSYPDDSVLDCFCGD